MRVDPHCESVPAPAPSGRAPLPPREALETLAARVEALARELQLLVTLAREAGPSPEPSSPPSSARPPPSEPAARPVRLAVEGARIGRRSSVLANDTRIDLQDSVFLLLLRFLLAHRREAGSWSTKADLGVTRSFWLVSRLRCALGGLLPAGERVIEADGRERFRLNPVLIVEPIDLSALARHPDAAVRKLAADGMA